MTSPTTEAQIALAREIADTLGNGEINDGFADLRHQRRMEGALAALQATQKADADLADSLAQSTQMIGGLADWSLSFDERQICSKLAADIRSGDHLHHHKEGK